MDRKSRGHGAVLASRRGIGYISGMPASARPDLDAVLGLIRAGRLDEAGAACRALLRAQPEQADAWYLLGQLAEQQGDLAMAVEAFRRTLALAPGRVPLMIRLAETLRQSGRQSEAAALLREALARDPAQARARLLATLAHPVNRPGDLAAVLMGALREAPVIIEAMRAAAALQDAAGAARVCAQLGEDTLLTALMTATVIPDAAFECLFTALRRALLLDTQDAAFGAQALAFCAALAIQAFLSDYAWDLDEQEAARLDALADAATLPSRLTLYAMYRPLHARPDAAVLAARAWPAPVAALVRVQISEPLAERADQAHIPQLTGIHDAVSQRVRAQYEQHPYPRWLRAGRAAAPIALGELLRALGAEAPRDASFARPEVLIAGCGSGEQSVYAASFYRDAHLLAVDLSRASLSYARRKTREAGLDTIIDYRQADILELGVLDRRFHVIESIGVLHHLDDPLAGWRVLTGLLRAGGLMLIALYSERGRRAIVEARAWIAAQGWPPTADGIRRCRRALLALPDGHPLAALRRMRDLYNLHECRDLLFHVQEHRYTLPAIEDMLAQLGLRFLGFSTPPAPGDPRLRTLAEWDAFEQAHPDTFSGMYQFWVQKR